MLTQEYATVIDEVVDSGIELTPEVDSFEYLDNFRLLITFENGEQRIFDARACFTFVWTHRF